MSIKNRRHIKFDVGIEKDSERYQKYGILAVAAIALCHACVESSENCFKRLFKSKKLPNGVQTCYNALKSCDPIARLNDKLEGMTVDEGKKVLNMADHIFCNRSVYSHHGLYDGNGMVYEYGGPNGDMNGIISHVTLEKFANGDNIVKRQYVSELEPQQIIDKAKSRLGENNYNLWDNNCENFVVWCYSGK